MSHAPEVLEVVRMVRQMAVVSGAGLAEALASPYWRDEDARAVLAAWASSGQSMGAFARHLSVRRRVAPLSPEDTWDYLLFRAKNAGATREIFTRDAAAFLHEAAGGTLRDLDRLAAAALHEASVHNRERVERDIADRPE